MEDNHYYPFSQAFNMDTTKEYRPTYKALKQRQKKRKLHFNATVQHVKNANLMVECSECSLWRLVFSRYKLSLTERTNLEFILRDHDYSCGAALHDLDLPEAYKDVEIRDHNCHDPIERLYYSCLSVYIVQRNSPLPMRTTIHCVNIAPVNQLLRKQNIKAWILSHQRNIIINCALASENRPYR